MLTSVTRSPEAASSASRHTTWAGDGRKSRPTRPVTVTTYQDAPTTINTRAAIARNSAVEMRCPSAKPGRLALSGRGIHEPGIDRRREIDILLQDPGRPRRLMDL